MVSKVVQWWDVAFKSPLDSMVDVMIIKTSGNRKTALLGLKQVGNSYGQVVNRVPMYWTAAESLHLHNIQIYSSNTLLSYYRGTQRKKRLKLNSDFASIPYQNSLILPTFLSSVIEAIYWYSVLLLLLLSCFSQVRLGATPWTAAHQAPLSLGFSRQEHWNGLPFPYPMHE